MTWTLACPLTLVDINTNVLARDAHDAHTKRRVRMRQYNRLKKMWNDAKDCPEFNGHIGRVLQAFGFVVTDGASDMRYNPSCSPNAFIMPKTTGNKDSKAMAARLQRYMRRKQENPRDDDCEGSTLYEKDVVKSLRCASHTLNLAFQDALQAVMPPSTHRLFKLAKHLAGPVKQCAASKAILAKASADIFRDGAFDEQGGHTLRQLLEFSGYIKIRWSSLFKMLKPIHRAGPALFRLQRDHRDHPDKLTNALKGLLFAKTGEVDAAPLWSHGLYAIICNLLDVFDPDHAAGGDAHESGADPSSRLIGFNEITRRFQCSGGAPVAHVAGWLAGFTERLNLTWPYNDDSTEEVIINVDDNEEQLAVDQGFEYDASMADEPQGSRLHKWLKTWRDSPCWNDDEWDEVWPIVSEFAVRLRRQTNGRFKDILPFYKMAALVHPANHAKDHTLPDDDPRMKMANDFGFDIGLGENRGGRAVQELSYRLNRSDKLGRDDYAILAGKDGLLDWYNHKAAGAWDVSEAGSAEHDMFVFAGHILSIMFTNSITESEFSIQNHLVGGRGGTGANLSVGNRRNLGVLRSGGTALDYARAGTKLSFEGNMLTEKPPSTKRS